MNKVHIAIIIAIILLIGGYYAYKNTQQPEITKTTSTAKAQVIQKLAVKEKGYEQIGFLDFEIIPESMTIPVNSTVRWTNYGEKPQIVKGIGFESQLLQKGDSYEHTFTQQGEYTYVSDIREFAILQGNIKVN